MSRRAVFLLAATIVLLAPFGEGGRTPPALFVLHSLALAAAVLAWAAPEPRPGRPARDPLHWIAGSGIAGLLLCAASALRATYPLAAGLGLWDLAVPAALFAVAAGALADDRDLSRLRAATVVSTTLQALLAIRQYPGGGATAAGAVFLNANHLAAWLNLGFLLSLSALLAAAVPRARVVWGAAAGAHLAALYLLESRGAFLALFAVLVVLGAGRFRGWPNRARLAALAALLLGLLAATAVLNARFSRSRDPYRYSRLAIWTASAVMIAERPLLGFGPGMFPHVSARYNFPADAGPVRYGRTFQGAHSAYLTLAAEAGTPAAALLLAAIAGAVLLCLRGRAAEDGAASGIGLALLAVLIQAGVDDLQARPALTLVPALLAGACAGNLARRRSGPAGAPGFAPAPSRSKPARLLAATVATYLLLVAVLLPYWSHREAETARLLGRSGLPHMERAARLNPLHPDYRNDLAMAVLNSGRLTHEGYARVAAHLLEARRLKPIDYRFPLHLARVEARAAPILFADPGAPERAAGLYREAVRLAPLDPRPRLELARHLADLGKVGEALETLRAALYLEPSFVRARVLEASILLDAGEPEKSRASLRLAESTLRAVERYVPDSGYARDIVEDAAAERARLAAILEGRKRATGPS